MVGYILKRIIRQHPLINPNLVIKLALDHGLPHIMKKIIRRWNLGVPNLDLVQILYYDVPFVVAMVQKWLPTLSDDALLKFIKEVFIIGDPSLRDVILNYALAFKVFPRRNILTIALDQGDTYVQLVATNPHFNANNVYAYLTGASFPQTWIPRLKVLADSTQVVKQVWTDLANEALIKKRNKVALFLNML